MEKYLGYHLNDSIPVFSKEFTETRGAHNCDFHLCPPGVICPNAELPNKQEGLAAYSMKDTRAVWRLGCLENTVHAVQQS